MISHADIDPHRSPTHPSTHEYPTPHFIIAYVNSHTMFYYHFSPVSFKGVLTSKHQTGGLFTAIDRLCLAVLAMGRTLQRDT